MTTEEKTCPACGTQFTRTSAAPRQKFCSHQCKHQWWNAERRQAVAALRDGAIPASSTQPRGDQPRDRDPGAGTTIIRDPVTLAATPACPHCRQPVAIAAWLVPPAAASVTTPPPASPQPASPRHAATVRDNP